MESSNTAIWNFIADDHFRESVIGDYQELDHAKAAGASKCVVVMAGSIIEALLVDYLITDATCGKTEQQILKMHLGEIITACMNAGIVSKQVEQLSTVVQDYRNLIHPSRGKRLGKRVSQSTANIAAELLKLVAEEVAEKRQATYGFTAEQVIDKLHNDYAAFRPAFASMLPKLHNVEKRKLLLKLLPAEYSLISDQRDSVVAIADKGDQESVNRWLGQHAYVMESFAFTYARADSETKAEVVKYYLNLVLHGHEKDRKRYEHAFFRPAFLNDTPDKDAQKTIIAHLFHMLHIRIDHTVLRCTKGIGKFINIEKNVANQRLNSVASMVAQNTLTWDGLGLHEWSSEFYGDLDKDNRAKFIAVIYAVRDKLTNAGKTKEAEKLQKLCGELQYVFNDLF